MRIKRLFWSVFALGNLIAAIHLSAAQVDFITTRSQWKYLVGNAEASTPIEAWRAVDFNDTTWLSGPAPIGYGEAELQTATIPSGTLSVYVRKPFQVTNPNDFRNLQLNVRVDDAYVAWINGVEVARYGVPPGELLHDAPATVTIAAIEPTDTTNLISSSMLVGGQNMLAIHVFNANATSSDILIDASLFAQVDDVAPVVVDFNPPRNATVRSLRTVTLTFSEDVTGADAADLLINAVPATDLEFGAPNVLKFNFDAPATGLVQVAFAPNHGIRDMASTPNVFGGTNWLYTFDPNASAAGFILNEFLASNGGSVNTTNAIRDEDGDSSDWMEIYNTSSTIERLDGWFLTDDRNILTKWQFPNNVTVGPYDYLIVWASGKNRTNAAFPLHANFQLNTSGEYLALVDPQTNVVSEFNNYNGGYPIQSRDVSYGRDRALPEFVGYFPTPTPRGPNGAFGSMPEVEFSVNGTTFRDPFALELSVPGYSMNQSEFPHVEIRYLVAYTAPAFTNVPGPSSLLYTNPITIRQTAQVRARAFLVETNTVLGQIVTNKLPGPIHSESFININANAASFSSDLPIVIINTAGSSISLGNSETATALDTPMIIATFDNERGYSSLSNAPDKVYRGGINIRGSSTAGYPKTSFAVEILDEFGSDKGVEFLGLPEESDWVLFAPNQFDHIGLHNPIGYEMSRQMGRYASRTRFVEVFLNITTNTLSANMAATGANMLHYHGIYVLEEKIKLDKNRVDIKEITPEMTNAPAITGGYLLKVDRKDLNEVSMSAGGQTIVFAEPPNLEMSLPRRAAQLNWIRNHLNEFNTVISGTGATNPLTGYSAYIDVDSWIDHIMIGVMTMNADAVRLSGYFYKDRNKKIEYGPIWDFDRAMGTSMVDNDWRAFNPLGWMAVNPLGSGTDFGTDFFNADSTYANPWYSKLFKFPDFWQAWIDRYQDFRKDVLSTNNLAAIIDQFANEVRPAHVRDVARWGGNGASDSRPRSTTHSVNPRPGRDPYGYSHTFDGTFQGEVDFQKRWFFDHVNFINTNLLNPPSFGSPTIGLVDSNFSLVINDNSGKAGTIIYYTLDGTDPRLSGGAISQNAIAYTGPISVTQNIRIFARAYNAGHRNLTGTGNPPISSPWSGQLQGSFYTGYPQLRITEIMYNPQPAGSGNTNDAQNFEYIELKNTGTTPLNLNRFRLSGGISFEFPNLVLNPGQYCVVVANTNAFVQRYGSSILIAGQFTGNLANGGDHIVLEGAAREPILDFNYSDGWYPITDGYGFSLVINDENAPLSTWGLESSWRASSGLNGTPGQANPAAPVIPVVYVNEVLSHTDTNIVAGVVDAIELHNPGNTPADISGWLLTDNPDEPAKYRIPDGTVIPAGGYQVFHETETFGQRVVNSSTGITYPGFRLSSFGEEVYLFSTTGTTLSGYVHGFDFGAQHNGVTFGRHVVSTGNDHFVAQSEPTLGAANAGPLVGPIVISEIMYRPIDIVGGVGVFDNIYEEFIELRNISATNVALFDSAFPTNTWRLQDEVQFDFPMNTTIPAGGYALIVNFNPTNEIQTGAFRTRYNVSSSVPLFGPYSGKLGNSGGRVELMRPDKPEPAGSSDEGYVPYVLVERIGYGDGAPWPVAADGVGPSLQRMVVSAYGNDPTNWVAAFPTPGAPYGGGVLPQITQHPESQTIVGNNALTLNVAATGSGPFTYQWLFNGSVLPGANEATLVFPRVKVNQAGVYSVVVINPAGAMVSSNATLNVLTPVTITQQPQPRSVNPGTEVTFTVGAYSSYAVNYQWRLNGVNISGATNASYSIPDAQPEHDGMYDVLLTDAISSDVSETVRLAVLVRPAIIQQPQSVILQLGDTFVASVQVTNTATTPVTYAWRRNGSGIFTNISTLREDTFVWPNIQFNNAGAITVSTRNEAMPGGWLSTNAFMTVVAGPYDQAATVGSDATFTAVVVNPGSVTRQARLTTEWLFNGAAISSPNATISTRVITNAGQVFSTNTLRLSNVQAADFGNYGIRVSVFTNVTIQPAVFTAMLGAPAADSDNDGMPDDWENAYPCLSKTADDANADADGDGMTNLAEYQAGTDPCNVQSYLRIESPMANGTTNVVLRFAAVSNKTYSVLYQNVLNPGTNWNKLADINSAPTNRVEEVIDANPAAVNRYYRLVTPRQ